MAIRIFRRNVVLCILALFLTLIAFHRTIQYAYLDLAYLTRPLWDSELAKFKTVITHYYAPGMSMQQRCEAHGWTLPTDPNRVKPRIFDSILFSVELDMLEIRMKELWDVVDHFIIFESNMTFTGRPKELVFANNRERFAFAESKILYKHFVFPYLEHESAWDREGRTRDGMTALFLELGLTENDLFTSVDLDEVIYPHTLELIKECEGVPDTMHLELNNYLYSFEFPTGDTIWPTTITRWYPGVRYIRAQVSDTVLTDSGMESFVVYILGGTAILKRSKGKPNLCLNGGFFSFLFFRLALLLLLQIHQGLPIQDGGVFTYGACPVRIHEHGGMDSKDHLRGAGPVRDAARGLYIQGVVS